MRGRRQSLPRRLGLALAASALFSGALLGQSSEGLNDYNGGPFTRGPVYEAPFSAEAVTTVNLTFPDGRRLAQRTTARYYRDGNGRVRVEHVMEGLPAARSPAERGIRLVIAPNPCEPHAWAVDPVTRTAYRFFPSWLSAMTVGASSYLPIPLDGGGQFLHIARADGVVDRETNVPPGTLVDDEPLGMRRISGLDVVGRRVTMTTATGQIGNDAPVVVRDEGWYSPDLHLVVAVDYSDSRYGTVRYRLTNLHREDPPSGLFVLPDGYDTNAWSLPGTATLGFRPLAAIAAPAAPRVRRP